MTIKLRRDTAANWTTAAPTLAAGQPGYETDTGKLKIGDGATAWGSLAYFGGTAGTVTSVSLTAPAIFSVAGSPVTTSGTLAITLANQTQNLVWASPNGSTGAPTFRALVAADVPTLNQSTTGSAATLTTGRTIGMTGDVVWTSASFNGSGNVTGTSAIQAGVVTLAMQANMATASVVYRKTAGAGAPEVQTLATLKTDLGLTGTNSGDQTITLTGDATGSGTGSFAVTVGKINGTALSGLATGILKNTTATGVPSIAAAATDYVAPSAYASANGLTMATARLLGRTTASTGAAEEITVGSGLSLSGGSLTATGGSGDMVLASAQTNSGLKTFLDGTLGLRNVANTFTALFTNTNTAARTYTLKDASGTLAFTSDITGTNSGTNTGDQTITLTGDVTGSGTGSFVATIASGAVTLAKMANMATSSLIYRKTAGSGAPEVNTLATLKTDLGLTGTNSGDQTITLTGDVTGSGTGSFAATIANSAVTNTKMANVATATFKGRTTAGTGAPEDLTATQATALLNVFTSTLNGLAPLSGGGTTNFLRADGTWTAPSSSALTNWTEAVNTSAPNATVPVVSLTAANAATDVDAALKPKGAGAITAHIADSTSTGGNKRAQRSVDWQTQRNAATQVASGAYSVLGGGYQNTASNTSACVPGGENNVASGAAAFASGSGNTASGDHSFVGGSTNIASNSDATAFGYSNTASGLRSFAAGFSTTSSGDYSTAISNNSTTRGLYGSFANASGNFSVQGDAQTGAYVARGQTTNGTPKVLTFDNSTAGTTNQVVLPNDSTYFINVFIAARRTDADNGSAAYMFQGCIDRNTNAASTSLVGTPVKTVLAEDTVAWDVTATADTTNGALSITVTGEAAKTISWVAYIQTVEVVG
jgi:hypothetical protein